MIRALALTGAVFALGAPHAHDDGYDPVSRADFEERFKMNLPTSASTIALYPRRAILRLGMLLRDSEVARRVRDYSELRLIAGVVASDAVGVYR
jgi:hypothetical protein